jgi:hypothetical protein
MPSDILPIHLELRRRGVAERLAALSDEELLGEAASALLACGCEPTEAAHERLEFYHKACEGRAPGLFSAAAALWAKGGAAR